ncbi:MAG: methylated-DNA--[protein]-cysteine S-methyltransferase [Magnetovibrio sp.]|nr:methylated-DNA--[protein]-cysteine S-methyltransferase [Magnetovibrio sp.]
MSADVNWLSFPSPVGTLTAFAVNHALVALEWGKPEPSEQTPTDLLQTVRDQMNAYFDGRLEKFNLPLSPAGTEFQRRVWTAMAEIPYGQTRTYGELADSIGGVARAVGGACGKNPIPIILPCHRVVGGGGKLTGFSGGAGPESKVFLLKLEGAMFL